MKKIIAIIIFAIIVMPVNTKADIDAEFFQRIIQLISYDNFGEFKVTYYWPGEDEWGYQTASGKRSQHLKTVAVDPAVIPLGTTIIIDGKEYTAIDTGGAVKGHVIDIFSEYPIHKTYRAEVFAERKE